VADTLVPECIAGLVTLTQAALAGLSVPASAVADGPFLGSDVPPEYVTVGWTTNDPPDIGGVTSGVGNDDRAEEFDIHCQLSVSIGDSSLTTVTVRAGVLLSAIGQALRADRTLGGALVNQDGADRTGPFAWERDVDTTGASVLVSYVVHVSVGWLA
jgi:hypothetical protein